MAEYLYNGDLLTPEFKDGMWTVSIDGVNFCSATREGLVPAIKSIFVIHEVGK